MIEGVMKKPRGRPRKEKIESFSGEQKRSPSVKEFKEKSDESIADYYEKNYSYLFNDDDFYPLTSDVFNKEFEHLETPNPIEQQVTKEAPDAILKKIIRNDVMPQKKHVENLKTLTPSQQERGLLGKLDDLIAQVEKMFLGDSHDDEDWLDE
jgi:hypothetical protein